MLIVSVILAAAIGLAGAAWCYQDSRRRRIDEAALEILDGTLEEHAFKTALRHFEAVPVFAWVGPPGKPWHVQRRKASEIALVQSATGGGLLAWALWLYAKCWNAYLHFRRLP
jgi:hypothetical protein